MICPRCKREAVGWPLERGDRCSPKDWIKCLRNPYTIYDKLRLSRCKRSTTAKP